MANYDVFITTRDSISGGNHGNNVSVELWVDGSRVAMETGDREKTMRRKYWDVAPWKGAEARIKIVDASADGPWGYISLDDVRYEADCPGTRTTHPPPGKRVPTGGGVGILPVRSLKLSTLFGPKLLLLVPQTGYSVAAARLIGSLCVPTLLFVALGLLFRLFSLLLFDLDDLNSRQLEPSPTKTSRKLEPTSISPQVILFM